MNYDNPARPRRRMRRSTRRAAKNGARRDAPGSAQRVLSGVSWEEVKVVQNLIERCLQQFMTQVRASRAHLQLARAWSLTFRAPQTEIVTALQSQAGIEPSFTCLVWQKLEEQNPVFFYSYNMRLRLRDQIVAFNYLVEQQDKLTQHALGEGVSGHRAVGSGGEAAAVAGETAAAADPAPPPVPVEAFLAPTPRGEGQGAGFGEAEVAT